MLISSRAVFRTSSFKAFSLGFSFLETVWLSSSGPFLVFFLFFFLLRILVQRSLFQTLHNLSFARLCSGLRQFRDSQGGLIYTPCDEKGLCQAPVGLCHQSLCLSLRKVLSLSLFVVAALLRFLIWICLFLLFASASSCSLKAWVGVSFFHS